jgi:hypothetical protein
MKRLGLAVLLALVGVAAACSLISKPCSDPMSCSCAMTQNPACPAWPSDDNPSWSQDAKRKPDSGVSQ